MFSYRKSYYLKHPIKFLNDLEREIAYRTYDKYQVVDTKLKPGYYDKDTLILHANFALLVDFVEVELADYPDTILSKIGGYLPRFIERPLFPDHRSADEGLKHINQRIIDHRKPYSKKDSGPWGNKEQFDKWQKHHLDFWLEVKSLYIWWTKERPNRKDDHDVVGLTIFRAKMDKKYKKTSEFVEDERDIPVVFPSLWDKIREKIFKLPRRREKLYVMKSSLNKTERKQERALYNKLHKLEQARDKEDTDNLIRLIKIRQGMWT